MVFSVVRRDNRAQLRRALLIMEQNMPTFLRQSQPASSHCHLFCQTKGEIHPFLHLVQTATRHLLNCVPGLGAQWVRAG